MANEPSPADSWLCVLWCCSAHAFGGGYESEAFLTAQLLRAWFGEPCSSSTKMNLFSKTLQLHLKLLSHSWKLTGEKWDTHKIQLQDDWEYWSQKCILCLSDRNLRTWLLECNVYTLFRVRIMCCSNWLWSEMCKQLLWEVFGFKGPTGLQDGLLNDLEGGLNTLGDETYDP